ncbi:tRNA cyclic N6-threonylcarbamoyladenosine(37) synthase TcdA [Sterolibacterium denitrificans]|uniref:tRNA cyclic N6-threonylcarbamoyladenosine(37) synthase TcdA n=1 Tax=Sterolibacterium denitrificans TaxID=157592 RepID=UPI0009F85B4B|nr:tRNA cyclic N6-threonylcarbamoyladenosine(37) synthase TcdA [Sterolibacterium denitrificans]
MGCALCHDARPDLTELLGVVTTELDFERRFGGINRLYGEDALARLSQAHVCVVGIGGVGSWAAEALARCGVGYLTLIDLDHIAESNTNRQIHALEGAYGQAKVTAMAARIRHINPLCRVTEIDDFITVENVARLLPSCDAVLDAIDDGRAKAALIAHCRAHDMPLVTTAAAGGRRDPTRIRVADLARTEHDPLAARLRAQLRKDYGFPRGEKQSFGVECVFSTESIVRPQKPAACASDPGAAPQGLNCAGYGSAVMVTASFGMVAAGRVIERLLEAGAGEQVGGR